MWKSLLVFLKAHIKFVARVIYTYLFFLIHTLSFSKTYSSCFMCVIVTCMRLPFSKIFSNFVHFCQNFQIFCPFLSFFWKIACMPLLSRTSPAFCWKTKSCCDRCFSEQIRPQTTVQLYVLQDYSSVRIGFNMINKCLLYIIC